MHRDVARLLTAIHVVRHLQNASCVHGVTFGLDQDNPPSGVGLLLSDSVLPRGFSLITDEGGVPFFVWEDPVRRR